MRHCLVKLSVVIATGHYVPYLHRNRLIGWFIVIMKPVILKNGLQGMFRYFCLYSEIGCKVL